MVSKVKRGAGLTRTVRVGSVIPLLRAHGFPFGCHLVVGLRRCKLVACVPTVVHLPQTTSSSLTKQLRTFHPVTFEKIQDVSLESCVLLL